MGLGRLRRLGALTVLGLLAMLPLPTAAASAGIDFTGNGMAEMLLISGRSEAPGRVQLAWTGSRFSPLCGAELDDGCGLAAAYLQHPLTRFLPGDFRGDGRTDLLVISGDPERPERSLLSATGAGFLPVCGDLAGNDCGIEPDDYLRHPRTWVLPGDFTGDGKTELFIISADREAPRRHLLGFRGDRFLTLCGGTDDTGCGFEPQNYMFHPRTRVLSGDFTGDGRSDVLVLSGDPQYPRRALLSWDGAAFVPLCDAHSGSACGLPTARHFTHTANQYLIADFTGNGKTDLLVISADPGAPGHSVYHATGQGFAKACDGCVFEPAEPVAGGLHQHLLHPRTRLLTGDFTGNGRSEVLLVSGDEEAPIRLLRAAAEAGFRTVCADAACGLPADPVLTHARTRFVVDDFTGSGRSELFVLSGEPAAPVAQLLRLAPTGFAALCGGVEQGGCGVPVDAHTTHHRTRLLPADTSSPPAVILGGSFFDADDVTFGLRAALTSEAAEVYLDGRPGQTYLTRPVAIGSDKILTLQREVTLAARPGSLIGEREVLLGVFDQRNVVIQGEPGAAIRLRKADYQDGEWRHAVSIRGSENVTVRDLIIEDSGGDGVYVGRGVLTPARYSNTVYLQRLTLNGHARNGISVISACNLLIEDNVVANTLGNELLAARGPWAGIDLEPNTPDEILKNVLVRNNRFEGNQNYGILLYLRNLNGNPAAEPLSVRIEGNVISDSGNGIKVTMPVVNGDYRQPGGSIDFVANRVARTDAAGLFITNKGVAGPRVNIYDLHLERTNRRARDSGLTRVDARSYLAPIVINKDRWTDENLDEGGLRLNRVHIAGNRRPYAVALDNLTGPGRISDIVADITVDLGAPVDVLVNGPIEPRRIRLRVTSVEGR